MARKVNSKTQSLRRVIADAAPQKRNEALQEEQNNSLGTINGTLEGIQAAAEMGAEATENGLANVGNSLSDTNAGIELQLDELSALNTTASLISDRINKLAEKLGVKVEQATPQTANVPSVEVVQDSIPEPVPEIPSLDDLLQDLIPPHENRRPDSDVLPQEEPKVIPKKEDEEKNKKGDTDLLKALLDTTKSGFKKSISLTDRISSMLFSYTVSAVANMAKTAAMVLALIMAIDIIKIHFKYWTELFKSNFEEFTKLAGTWAPVLTAISEMAQSIQDTFNEGSWLGLAEAIVKGLVNVLDTLGETIMFGLSKLVAAVLSKVPGMGDAADNIRGAAADRFQYRTGAELSEEDQDYVAKYKDNQRLKEEQDSPLERKITAWGDRYLLGKIDDAEYEKRMKLADSDTKDPAFEGKTREQRLEMYKAQGKMQAELKRTSEYAQNTRPENTERMESAANAVAKASKNFEEFKKNNPSLAKELEPQYRFMQDEWNKKRFPTVSPEPAEDKQESQQVKVIEKIEAQHKVGDKLASQAPMNVNTSINKNSTTVMPMQPVTSSPAPGMVGFTKSN
ncbi:TPA: hypothetical protein ACGE0Z_002326 [Klebsiella pneumoniae]